MRGSASGYTIIEVLIVLAISGVLLAAGIATFKGKATQTAFEQSMQDLNSEFIARIKDVNSGQLLNEKGYTCTYDPATGRPKLSSQGTKTLGNEDCLVIGSAIEAVTSDSNIYIYTILGNRLVYAGANATSPAANLNETKPTPALANDSDLVVRYKLTSDVRIVSSNTTTTSGANLPTSLIGFYTDFGGENNPNQNGAQSVSGQAYTYQSGSHDQNAVKNCIEKTACTDPSAISLWKLCFQNDKGDQTAEVDITTSTVGATANLKFVNCS